MRKSFAVLWSLFLAACEATSVSTNAPADEQAAWDQARATDTVESYRAFLGQFPQGVYAEQAARELMSEEQELVRVPALGPSSRDGDRDGPY